MLVDDDNLCVRVGLGLEIGNCSAQVLRPAESGDDHGDEEGLTHGAGPLAGALQRGPAIGNP